MKDAEEAIGKVLAGLRDTEAPSGMERRIFEAVESRAAARPAATPRWAWSVATAGVIAVSLLSAVTAFYWRQHPSTQARQRALPAESRPANGSATGPRQASLPPHEPTASAGTPSRIAAPVRKVQPMSAADAVLFSELRAPSHPAPAAPLTEEEKLLLSVVHKGDPQLMAMLNPELRASREAELEAEFRKLFEQPTEEDHQSNQTTE